MNPKSLCAFVGLIVLSVLSGGCQSAYYGAMEKMGVHKRDILVDRVESAKNAQEDAKEQFVSTFDQFVSVSGVEVSELKKSYDSLQKKYDASEAAATDVIDRISGIRSVAEALFKEWGNELDIYSNEDLRKASEAQLDATKELYAKLMVSMEEVSNRMTPVLEAFRDQTLFLKHNLNAQAISALNQTSMSLEAEVEELIAQMETSINEANDFIEQMREG
ncbi:DUF2959 domain-containing protein [Puniceicoccaceae bacterium K14]|nr:DUF2959 domain-containing protein [Puniceicoccaceae bacterium K14]